MTPPGEPPPAQPEELSVPDALRLGVRLHREGRLDLAEAIYRRVLAAVPDHPDALHFLGVLVYRRGSGDEAVELIRRAIARVPDFPDFHLNLGNILTDQGRLDGAREAYQSALRLRPDYADAWNNLGSIERHLGHPELAEKAYRRALEIDPGHVGAHNNLGVLCSLRGDIREATEYFCKAIVLDPEHPDGYQLLGVAYATLGETDKAAEVFRTWVAAEPDNPVARHHLAACSGRDVPERAPDDYVAYTFDRFAASFESKLQGRLHYQAPQLVAAALARHLPPPDRQFTVLDAGCGTGLCGPLLAPWARHLTGVDLSAGMIEQAGRKASYDQLVQAELGAFLAARPAAYEVIASADTLCYFGALGPIVGEVFDALTPGGRFAFTLERLEHPTDDEGVRLMPSGRYQHTRALAEATLADAGFTGIESTLAALRDEGGVPVSGIVLTALRPTG